MRLNRAWGNKEGVRDRIPLRLKSFNVFICERNKQDEKDENNVEDVTTLEFTQIGKRIHDVRKTKGISQEDLAKGICSQAQISKIEKGQSHPTVKTLFLISERLEVDCYYFVGATSSHILKNGA
jgi:ribosome-binding protein aMBF1 (putative translation factor)